MAQVQVSQRYWGKPTKIPAGKYTCTCRFLVLKYHVDGGGHLSLKNPPNLQVPLRKLPYLVIFTCLGVTSPTTGTHGLTHHGWG